MANPSSSRHDHDERERRHRSDRHSSSSHHHRTISSTTLLLVLSVMLVVLAILQALSSSVSSEETTSQGVWGYLTPKRSQALVARESSVAAREAEVARREAELLVGAPGGVIPTQTACPVCPTEPVQTIIKEVVQESSLAPPSWFKEASVRAEEILDRELKIAEREREISKREESVNRREHDASRRESWIMEQLILLGNDNPQTVEEEYVYEPAGPKRKPKLPLYVAEAPYEVETMTIYETLPPSTVTVPAPANTRLAAFPTPEVVASSTTSQAPRTTIVDVLVDPQPTSIPRSPERRPPARWFGGW